MAVILGTTSPKPASAARNTSATRPPPIDSRTKPETALLGAAPAVKAPSPAVNVALPSDVNALRTMQQNVAVRLLAAEVQATGIAGAGISIDDLARLGAARLRELKANAACKAEFSSYDINSHFEKAEGAASGPGIAGGGDEFARYDINSHFG